MKVYIARHSRAGHFNLQSKEPFFSKEFCVKIHSDKIVFSRPGIDFNGKIHNPRLNKKTGYYITSVAAVYDLPIGVFDFDSEESNEDFIVVYYN